MIITIDGPTASGKTSVARILARDLDFIYVSSGLLYRALAFVLMHEYNYDLQDLLHPNYDDVQKVLDSEVFHYLYDQNRCCITYKGEDITSQLKMPDIAQGASFVGQDSQVRLALSGLQRQIVDQHNAIVEGRDSGSVVFPKAEYKFFLTASVEVRALRWQKLQASLGTPIPFQEAKELLLERDTRDTTRDYAPLTIPEGAYIIDNSDMTLEQTVQYIEGFLKLNTTQPT
jgi:CMP/dCMP kinase